MAVPNPALARTIRMENLHRSFPTGMTSVKGSNWFTGSPFGGFLRGPAHADSYFDTYD